MRRGAVRRRAAPRIAILIESVPLFALHVLLSGAACAAIASAGVHAGFTFSQGLLDLLRCWTLDTRPWMAGLLGPPLALLYYTAFRLCLRRSGAWVDGKEEDQT